VTKPWEKRLNGPDWMDLHRRVRSIEHTHTVELTIAVRCVGTAVQPVYDVHVIAFDAGPADLEGLVVQGLSGSWPDGEHAEMDSFIHDMLYQIDYIIGQSYQQRRMPLDRPLGT